MTDLNHTLDSAATIHRPLWSAVWAGVFSFLALWFVFGTLCVAIFAGTANFTVALSVWGIILTIIAMFVAGRATGYLAGVYNSRDGAMLGTVMFGLAMVAALFVLVTSANWMGASRTLGETHLLLLTPASLVANFGWAIFVALLLGWVAAMGGASTAHKELAHPAAMQQREVHA